MRVKPFEQMRGLTPDFEAAIKDRNGGEAPDNFVESAEGTILGRPNLDTDQPTREAIARLDEIISKNFDDVKDQLKKY